MAKSSRMRRAEHVGCLTKMRKAYTFIEKNFGKRPFWRINHK
jgi:hypothetical protein